MANAFLERSLPSDQEAERGILGSIQIDNALMADAAERLVPSDFYAPLHARVFKAMLELFAAGKAIEPIMIGNLMEKDSPIQQIGGIATITMLTYGIPHNTNIDDLIDIVRQAAKARKLIRICSLTQDSLVDRSEDYPEALDTHEQLVSELRNKDTANGFVRLGESVGKTLLHLKDLAENPKDGLLGISTGFKDLDYRTSGYERKDLIICAARPSMGKTALILQSAYKAALSREAAVVAVFSLEMSKEQLTQRMMSTEAGVDLMRLRKAQLTREEWSRVKYSTDQLDRANLLIDDSPGLNTMQIRARLRRLAADQKRLDLVVVDHLGLIRHLNGKRDRHLQLSDITKDLKAIAKEFDVPIVALCQLSREVEKRKPPRPIMSDLRESGAIEEDADIVMFIYREEYYKAGEHEGEAEIIFGKNRNGPTGTDKLAFRKAFTRFEDHSGVF